MGTMVCPIKEDVSETPKREIGARPKALKCESLLKGALGGVKDLRIRLDPLDVVKASTPGIVKTGLKSGSALSVKGVTLNGIGRQHDLAVRPAFIFPGGVPGSPLISLTVSLEGVVTTLVVVEVGEAKVSDGEGGSKDHAKYGHSTY